MDDFFAPPPFRPADALQRLQRELKALGLAQRGQFYERQGMAWVKAEHTGAVLKVAVARVPARTPEWQPRELKDNAQVRDFIEAVKQRMARQRDDD